MLSLDVYKLVHLFGMFMVFVSLGGVILHALNDGTREANPARRLVSITFGVGLFLVLLGGFGQMARLGLGSPATWGGWLYAKLAIWLLIGGLFTVPYRRPERAKVLWIGVPVLGLLAGWLALFKPF